MNSPNFLQGTIAELEGRISMNGKTLDQPALSVLTRIGDGVFARCVGSVKTTSGRGKPAKIWVIDTNIGMQIAVDDPAVTIHSHTPKTQIKTRPKRVRPGKHVAMAA